MTSLHILQQQLWPLMFGWVYPQSTFSLTNTLKHLDTFSWISSIPISRFCVKRFGIHLDFWPSMFCTCFHFAKTKNKMEFLKGKFSTKIPSQYFKPQVGNTQPIHELTNMVRRGIKTQWKSVCYPPTIHPSWCVDSSRRTLGQNVGLCDP